MYRSHFKKAVFILMLILAWSGMLFAQTNTPITTPVTKHINGYWEYLPAGYAASSSKYPLLIFFHGIDEVGDGSQKQLNKVQKNAVPKLIKQNKFPTSFTVNGKTFSFIVICPQLNIVGRSADEIDDLISYLEHKYRVDESRIYLTGISLGGGTCMFYAGSSRDHAGRVAAMVTSAENLNVTNSGGENVASANLPLWMTHNEYDRKIPARNTLGWYDFLTAYKPAMKPLPVLNLFEQSGHDAWSTTFNPNWRPQGLNVYEWMLQYTRGGEQEPPPDVKVHAVINAPDTVVFNRRTPVLLDGSGSYSDDHSRLFYKWECISGPAGFNITNATDDKSYFAVRQAGQYVLKLTVFSGWGNSASQTKTITVVDRPQPVAIIKNDSVVALPANAIELDASASYDRYGKIVAFDWQYISGPQYFSASNRKKPSLQLQRLTAGVYRFSVIVTNDAGLRDTATTSFKVVGTPPANKPPVAVIKNDAVVVLPKDSILLDASTSYDNRGKVAAYNWQYVSGPSGFVMSTDNASSIMIKKLQAGAYRFGVIVTDDAGLKDTAITSFTVKSAPVVKKPPIAVIKNDAVVTLPKDSIRLDASASYDNDGIITTYEWRYVSGQTGFTIANNSASSVVIGKLSAGTYRFEVIVTNDAGLKDTAVTSFSVNEAAQNEKAPIAVVKNAAVILLPVDSISLDAGDSYDSNGRITGYEWRFISGPQGFTMANNKSAVLKIESLVEGFYRFGVIVTNDAGLRDTGFAKFSVKSKLRPNPPVAIIKNDGLVTLPNDSIVLDASASYDSTARITGYDWRYIFGPEGFSASGNGQSVFSIRGLRIGSYRFGVIITNSAGLKDTAITNFVVKNGPKRPTAPEAIIKNENVIVLPKDSIVLDASASFDNSGNIVNYDWRYVFGPEGFTMDANKQVLTIRKLSVGSYRFGVIVRNSFGLKDTAIANFVVKNQGANILPVAVIKAPSVISLPQRTATLDGSASFDVDGIIQSYQWQYISGPLGFTVDNNAGPICSVRNLSAGIYIFRLTVEDDKGGKSAVIDTLTVSAAPIAQRGPVAIIRANSEVLLPDNFIRLDGTSSYDPDGHIKYYSWRYVSGPAEFKMQGVSQPEINVSDLVNGKYSFMLIVTDDRNNRDSALCSFVVKPEPVNKLPLVIINAPSFVTLPDRFIELDGSRSYDPDGTIKSFTWSYLSGPAGYVTTSLDKPVLAINNLVEGNYKFRLTVTDNGGNVADTAISFIVRRDNVNLAPIAIIQGDSVYTWPVTSIEFKGSSSYDPDGVIKSYRWRMITAPIGIAMSNSSDAQVDISGLIVGKYKLQLQVTDNKGQTATTFFSFTIKDGQSHADALAMFVLAPVPAIATLSAALSSDEKGKLTLRMTDFNGKVVFLKNYDKQSYRWQQTIDVANLASGLYFVDVYIGKTYLMRRFIKGGK